MRKKPITEDTMFRLSEVKEAFQIHFDEEVKSLPTLLRYCKGVRVPHSNKLVRLDTVLDSSRARMTCLRYWKKFLADLVIAYQEAMRLEDNKQ
jgi:hypothetical protein